MASNPTTAPRSQSELNSWLVEEMYEQYRDDPSQLPASWRDFFEGYRPEEPASNGAKATAAPADVVRPAAATPTADGPEPQRMRGVAARIVENMEQSLGVPTATSVRDVPAKLLEVNRRIVNNYLQRTRGGKVSFTHLIAFAMVRAVETVPAMTRTFAEVDGNPAILHGEHFGLGLAVDVQKDDGSRTLMVPVIKQADTLTFAEFLAAYEEVIRKIRTNKITPDMFAGGTITVTNPGTIGTVSSVPRLMAGQSAILGVGTIAYPAEYAAADARTMARLGVGKLITLTSTYDHRVIQGAESGAYLKRVHELLLGQDGFYDEVFKSLGMPYEPARWRVDAGAIDQEAMLEKQMKVDSLANMYRVRGHLIADLDPLRQREPEMHPELDPTYYGLSIWDLDREFLADIGGEIAKLPMGKILGTLRDAYCRTIGIEYGHMLDPEQKTWWREQLEGVDDTTSDDDQRWILERLNSAEAFESFLHTKYVGQKRFGLEGAESLIPLLDAIAEGAADDEEMHDIVVGMAHRGRLNVLVNILGKDLTKLFREFEGDIDPDTVQGSGDVKYHLGTTGKYESPSGADIPIELAANPSHLESVDPIVMGMVRARQDQIEPIGAFSVLPLLIHGDAAFAGQGIVAECLAMSDIAGYRVGGTIHLIINNQIGFTTAPEMSRSSLYCSDVAKTVQAPIFHVNGDDPEACVRVARLAWEYRQKFHKDVVIDMVCYRRHGHNEGDDPSYTQPLMYQAIAERRSVRKLYVETLVKRGDITVDEAEQALSDFQSKLQIALEETRSKASEVHQVPPPPKPAGVLPHIPTGVDRHTLERVFRQLTSYPDGFTPHPKLAKQFELRNKQFESDHDLDWATAEALAIGSLILEGHPVRLAGQDSRRGTFSQRHAAVVDFETGVPWIPLAGLEGAEANFWAYDSLLSEYAALGYEYGYAHANTEALVIWEAQFGDFINGAQIIIDQYIVAAEDKWGQRNGVVLLLPHGYEGQGPEHSSARIERFLTLAAEDNMQVCNATTAAQYFHLLRRQVHSERHTPLVLFTPKQGLRMKQTRSHIDDLTTGSFHEVLDDPQVSDPATIERVVFCSGKVAWDAMAARDERNAPVAIVRVEQLYPLPTAEMLRIVQERYPNAKELRWLQEEPANMGAWNFIEHHVWRIKELGYDLRHIARHESGSPATGSKAVNDQELAELMDRTFADH